MSVPPPSVPPPGYQTGRGFAPDEGPAVPRPRRPERGRHRAGPVSIAAALALLALAVQLSPLSPLGGNSEPARIDARADERAAITALIADYVAARSAGDGEAACEQITPEAQRELVALVSHVDNVDANPARCPEHVLAEAPESDLTKRELAAFGHAGIWIDFRGTSADPIAATAGPENLEEPTIGVLKRGGRWRIDDRAEEAATLITFCEARGGPAEGCWCLFDVMRERNDGGRVYLSEQIDDLLTGRPSPLAEEAASRCRLAEERLRI